MGVNIVVIACLSAFLVGTFATPTLYQNLGTYVSDCASNEDCPDTGNCTSMALNGDVYCCDTGETIYLKVVNSHPDFNHSLWTSHITFGPYGQSVFSSGNTGEFLDQSELTTQTMCECRHIDDEQAVAILQKVWNSLGSTWKSMRNSVGF